MNKIEEPLASQRYFGDQYMSACDQICMAIAIDESCCLKSSKEKVNFKRSSIYNVIQNIDIFLHVLGNRIDINNE